MASHEEIQRLQPRAHPPSERLTPCESPGGGPEHLIASTWEWKKVVKIEPPARAIGTAAPKASPRERLAQRQLRKPLDVQVRYRGGPECWWELKARGRVWRFPGHVCLHDALTFINNSPSWREDPER